MFNAAWLYKNYTYKIEKLKWADSLRSITKIVLNERKNLEMKIYYDSKINKIETSSEKIKEKSKDSRGLLFISLKVNSTVGPNSVKPPLKSSHIF